MNAPVVLVVGLPELPAVDMMAMDVVELGADNTLLVCLGTLVEEVGVSVVELESLSDVVIPEDSLVKVISLADEELT